MNSTVVCVSLCWCLLSLLGCASSLDNRWTFVECHRSGEVRIHTGLRADYIIGGDPHWKFKWAKAGEPAWTIPPCHLSEHEPWYRIVSADVSVNGHLVLARRVLKSGRTQVYDIRDGRILREFESCPLSVAWSRDGHVLAILEWLNPTRDKPVGEPPSLDDVRLALYDSRSASMQTWPVEFQPSKGNDTWWNNCFVISWSADDSLLLVSTKRALRSNLVAKAYVIDPRHGPTDVVDASDAFFVGSKRFVANKDGQWNGAAFYSVTDGIVGQPEPVGREIFAAGSSPEEGAFLAYKAPDPWPALRFALPVVLMNDKGELIAEDRSGYSYGSSLCMLRTADPLATVLRDLLNRRAAFKR